MEIWEGSKFLIQSKMFGLTIAPRGIAFMMVLDNSGLQITEAACHHRNKTDQSSPCITESPQFEGMLNEGAKIEQAITNVSIDGLTPSVGADMCSNATSELIHIHALVSNPTELVKMRMITNRNSFGGWPAEYNLLDSRLNMLPIKFNENDGTSHGLRGADGIRKQ